MHDISESLRTATINLRLELEWMKAWNGDPAEAALGHLRQVQTLVSACGNLVREGRVGSASTTLQSVIREYSECLQRIEETLPIFQRQLLAQRSRLEGQHAHFHSATNWAQCSKNTI
jgi:hypothetical protein